MKGRFKVVFLVLIFVLVAFSGQVFADTWQNQGKGLDINVYAGFLFNCIGIPGEGFYDLNYDFMMGEIVGAEITYNIFSTFYIATGLNFLTRGFGYEEDSFIYEVACAYANIPLTVQGRIWDRDHFKLYLYLGGYFEFLVNAVIIEMNESTYFNPNIVDNVSDQMNTINAGYTVGIGAELIGFTGNLYIQQGFLAYSQTMADYRLFSIGLTLGFSF